MDSSDAARESNKEDLLFESDDGALQVLAINKDDLDQIYRIEQAAHVVPWDQKTFDAAMHFQGAKVVLKSHTEGIVGFALLSQIADELHLLNIAVDPVFQGRGYGGFLLDYLLQSAKNAPISMMILEVRKSNIPAIKLYEKRGFNEIGLRKNYYPTETEKREDAIVMAYAFYDTMTQLF